MYFQKIWVSTFGTIFETNPDLNHRVWNRTSELNLPHLAQVYTLSEKMTCTLIEELFRPVRLFFLEIVSPCTVIPDSTFIRDVRVGSNNSFWNIKEHFLHDQSKYSSNYFSNFLTFSRKYETKSGNFGYCV